MKNSIAFLILSLWLVSCGNQEQSIDTSILNNKYSASNAGDTQMPEMTFDSEVYNFGEITEGDSVQYSFEFENTGNEPLLIFDVKAECGCTVPNDWPKQPIAPGDKSKVSITFDSHGKLGNITKRLTINANTSPATNVVAIRGIVNRKP